MKTITVYVDTGLVGSRQTNSFVVPDDTSDEAIEAEAREIMFEMIEWGFSVEGESED